MTRPRARKRLRDAYGVCDELASFTAGRTLEEYETDRGLRLIVERLFAILGEALHQAFREEAALEEEIPELRKIVGVRNRIIHGYDVIRNDVLWDIARNDVPVLQDQIEGILKARGWE